MMLYGGQDGQTTCTVAKVRSRKHSGLFVTLHFDWTAEWEHDYTFHLKCLFAQFVDCTGYKVTNTSTYPKSASPCWTFQHPQGESRRVGRLLTIRASVVRTWTHSQNKSVQPPVTALFTLDLCWLAFKMCSSVICSHPTDVFSEPFFMSAFLSLLSPSLIVSLSFSVCLFLRLTGGYSECDQVHWAAQSSAR